MSIRRFISILILVAIIFWPCINNAQDINYSKLFTTTDGLQDRQVKDVIRDDQGKFWLLFNSGLQIYDGRSFVNVEIPNHISISRYDRIKKIDGGYLILEADGEVDGVSIDTRRLMFHVISAQINMSNRYFVKVIDNRLCEVHVMNGSIALNDYYTKTEIGTYFIDFTMDDEYISQIYKVADYVYIRTNQFRLFGGTNELTVIRKGIGSILGIINGQLWIKELNNKVCKLGSNFQCIQMPKFNYPNIFINTDQSGNQLIAVSEDPNRISRLTMIRSDGVQEDYSRLLYHENSSIVFYGENFMERLFIGTHQGLWYFNLINDIANRFVDVNSARGVFGHILYSPQYRPKDKRIYFIKELDLLLSLSGETIDTILPNATYPHAYNTNQRMVYDIDQDVIIGLHFGAEENGRISRYDIDNNKLEQWRLDFGVDILKVFGDHIWIGGYRDEQGVFQIRDKATMKVLNEVIVPDRVTDLLLINNDIYVGSRRGIQVYNIGTDFKVYFSTSYLPESYIVCLYLFDELLIAGTAEHGLMKRDTSAKEWTCLSTSDGLSSNFIGSVLQDENSNFWIGTNKGIAIADKNCHWIRNLTEDDGMFTMETNRFSSCMDATGEIYFGTINGLYSVDPKEVLSRQTTQRVVVDELSFFDGDYKTTIVNGLDQQLTIPYGADTVIIDYHSYDYPSDLDATPPIVVSSNEYDRVIRGPDDANFIVLSGAGQRQVDLYLSPFNNQDASTVSSLILHAQSFWEKYFFVISLSLISFISLGLLIYNRRKRRIEQLKSLEMAHEASLNKIKLHALQAQMNPHFIFNALGSIQYFVQKEETDIADNYLSDFASLMRLILESSKSEFMSLKNEIRLLQLYVKLEHLRFNKKFDYAFDIESDIDMDYLVPPMIIQPFVENAVLHGFQHLQDHKGFLTISFSSDEDERLICIINDNGIGRKRSSELKIQKHLSRGTQIIADRIESIQKDNQMKIDVETIDLYDGDRPTGTEVIITFTY